MTVVPAYGFPGTIRGPEYARLQWCASVLAPSPHGVATGGTVAPASGVRKITVAPGLVFAPGVYADIEEPVELTLDSVAASRGRLDVPVVEFDWVAKTAAVKVVKGTAAADSPGLPDLDERPGVFYQVALSRYVELDSTTTTLAANNMNMTGIVADTGWVPTTPAGNWSRAAAFGLAVRRRGGGDVKLSGRLVRATDSATLATGSESGISGLRLIPPSFLPSREISTYAAWDLGSTAGQAFIRIDELGFGYITPMNKPLTAGNTLRIADTTWEI